VNRKASLIFGSVYKKIIALMETKVKYFHNKYSDDLPLEEYRTSHGGQKDHYGQPSVGSATLKAQYLTSDEYHRIVDALIWERNNHYRWFYDRVIMQRAMQNI
jgi:hypothetical protein